MSTRLSRDQDNDTQIRIQAELQVEVFIQLLSTRYGLKSEDIPQILDDLRWLHQSRGGIVRIQWAVALGILAIALTGVLSAFWEGLKHAIKS